METADEFYAKLQLGKKERLERSKKVYKEIEITFNKIIAAQNKTLKILDNIARTNREFRRWFEGIEERDRKALLAKNKK